jgi:hypothetical protein
MMNSHDISTKQFDSGDNVRFLGNEAKEGFL